LLLLIHFMRALMTSILINVLLLIYFIKKTLVNTLMAEESFVYFLTHWIFEEGRSAMGSPVFLFFNSLSSLTLTLTLTLNPSHSSLWYIFYLCQTNLIFYLVPKSWLSEGSNLSSVSPLTSARVMSHILCALHHHDAVRPCDVPHDLGFFFVPVFGAMIGCLKRWFN